MNAEIKNSVSCIYCFGHIPSEDIKMFNYAGVGCPGLPDKSHAHLECFLEEDMQPLKPTRRNLQAEFESVSSENEATAKAFTNFWKGTNPKTGKG